MILRHTNTWVTCHACGAKLFAKVRCADLVLLTPRQTEHLVVRRVSLISRFLALTAALLCLLPMIGTVMAVLAMASNWRPAAAGKRRA